MCRVNSNYSSYASVRSMLDTLRMGSFEDRKAYARLIRLYKIVYDLFAILLPQYITQPHQIYTSSPDTATTINTHFYC